MDSELTAQNERYLIELVSAGVYASRAAALNAAVEALMVRAEDACGLPVGSVSNRDAATASLEPSESHPVDDDHWRRLDRLVEENQRWSRSSATLTASAT